VVILGGLVPQIAPVLAEAILASRELEGIAMAQLLECDDCGALMTAELLIAHQDRHAESSRRMHEAFMRA